MDTSDNIYGNIHTLKMLPIDGHLEIGTWALGDISVVFLVVH